MPDNPPGTLQVRQLVELLVKAESAVVRSMTGTVDAIVHQGTQSRLLKEARQALQRSELAAQEQADLFSAVIENASDFIYYLGSDRRVRYANKMPLGLARDAVIDADWLALQMPDHRGVLERVFASVLESGQAASDEGPGWWPCGSADRHSRRFGPVRRGDETVGVVVVARDITFEKGVEAQLLLSDRMASVGALAAGVAHEINNPLAAVIANLEVIALDLNTLAKTLSIPAEIHEEISDARQAAERVRVIVRDLKIFSRAEDDKRGAVDVERALDSTLRMAWNEIRHRARLIKDYGRVPNVHGNESRLGQVFLNLVMNAAQAIPEGNAAGNTIRIATSSDFKHSVVVKISDTGAGIPQDVRKRLFTPFFTTKPAGHGTGLGLSICQRIVRSLGGDLSFESELGKGTEFRVCLPAAGLDYLAVESATIVPSAARRGRILIVDDEIAVGAAAKRILAQEHDVVLIDSGAHALEALQSGESFDVVLCDLMMPQVTGMDLHSAVARSNPAQANRFVFLTGGVFTPSAHEFLETVRNLRLEKPFSGQALRAAVNGLIE